MGCLVGRTKASKNATAPPPFHSGPFSFVQSLSPPSFVQIPPPSFTPSSFSDKPSSGSSPSSFVLKPSSRSCPPAAFLSPPLVRSRPPLVQVLPLSFLNFLSPPLFRSSPSRSNPSSFIVKSSSLSLMSSSRSSQVPPLSFKFSSVSFESFFHSTPPLFRSRPSPFLRILLLFVLGQNLSVVHVPPLSFSSFSFLVSRLRGATWLLGFSASRLRGAARRYLASRLLGFSASRRRPALLGFSASRLLGFAARPGASRLLGFWASRLLGFAGASRLLGFSAPPRSRGPLLPLHCQKGTKEAQ